MVSVVLIEKQRGGSFSVQHDASSRQANSYSHLVACFSVSSLILYFLSDIRTQEKAEESMAIVFYCSRSKTNHSSLETLRPQPNQRA